MRLRLEKRSPTPHLHFRPGTNRQPAERNATLTFMPHAAAAQNGRKSMVDGPPVDSLSKIIVDGLEDAKADDIVTIELSGKTTLADRMIIASGRSSTHVGAIADRVMKACRDAGFPAPKVEGLPLCDWVLLDARDAIVHIFRPDVRQFYNLEKMWSADRPGEARRR
jgi:ribosome-associated protein